MTSSVSLISRSGTINSGVDLVVGSPNSKASKQSLIITLDDKSITKENLPHYRSKTRTTSLTTSLNHKQHDKCQCCKRMKYQYCYISPTNPAECIYNLYLLFLSILILFVIGSMNYILFFKIKMESPYSSNSRSIPFSFTVSDTEISSLLQCNIMDLYLLSWFDALSFDFTHNIWRDKVSENDIILNESNAQFKLGYIYNEYYLYGNGYDHIIFPETLNLYSNYTILTIAKYNGNNNGFIFISDDVEWFTGFRNETHNITINSWQLITDQLQHISYGLNEEEINIKWGINISDFEIAALMIFPNTLLDEYQIECLENVLTDNYQLFDENIYVQNVTSTDNKIKQCEHYDSGTPVEYMEQMIAWYDINNINYFDGYRLYDISNTKWRSKIPSYYSFNIKKNEIIVFNNCDMLHHFEGVNVNKNGYPIAYSLRFTNWNRNKKDIARSNYHYTLKSKEFAEVMMDQLIQGTIVRTYRAR
eukprot:434468_1